MTNGSSGSALVQRQGSDVSCPAVVIEEDATPMSPPVGVDYLKLLPEARGVRGAVERVLEYAFR